MCFLLLTNCSGAQSKAMAEINRTAQPSKQARVQPVSSNHSPKVNASQSLSSTNHQPINQSTAEQSKAKQSNQSASQTNRSSVN
jgi:hypothetical protein